MAEDLSKYGTLRGWEWWQPSPRRPYTYPRPGGLGIAQAQAAAAGYSSVEEWEAAGWPHPIDPETGKPYEGWKIARIEGGLHPTGRKMTDEDWFDPATQRIFDYLEQARAWSSHRDWAEQMRAKYPDYPMPGVNINDLLRKLFPEWYEAEEPVVPEEVSKPSPKGVAPTEVAPTPQIPELSPEVQRWMAWARGLRERMEKRPPEVQVEEGALPSEITPWLIWSRARAAPERRFVPEALLPPTERGEVPPRPEEPVVPKKPMWEELIGRAKAWLLAKPIQEPVPTPEEVISRFVQIPPISAPVALKTALDRLESALGAGVQKIISTALLPAEWTEYAIGQGMIRTTWRTRIGEVPEEHKGYPKAEAEYELGNLLASLDDETRGLMINSLARIAWSTPEHHVKAAKRILDPTEYEKWARYEGELVEIEPGTPLKPGYEPAQMYDPDIITQILRQEEWPLGEFVLRSLIDPTLMLYVPEVRAAPGAVWRRLTGARTPAQRARQVFTQYYGAQGQEMPAYVEEFLQSAKGKPRWYQQAMTNIVDDWFRPLASRFEAWKARGAPAVIQALPPPGGDFTDYMRAAATAEREVRRSYALVYPRAGTSDPNFLEIMAKAMSGGLNPTQIRQMQVLRIEAEAYRAMGNAEGVAEKVAALEKLAKEGLPLGERWKSVWELFKTKTGSMSLLRPTPGASRDIMADNATRVLGWMFEDMPSGLDRATAVLLFKKDPKQLLKEFPWIDSKAGLEAFMVLQHIRDDSLGSLAYATGVPSLNTQAGWTALHEALRRIAGTYYYPAPRPDPWQRMIGQFYRVAPRTFLSTGRYPIQNIQSNFTNIWGRYGWVRPRTDADSLGWINRLMGDAGFLPPGFARSITAAGEVSTERIPSLIGRKWVYGGPEVPPPKVVPREPAEVPEELRRRRLPVEWAARLVKGGARYLPFMEGWIDLSKWGERNASMANYRDMVETLKGSLGQPGRGFLPSVPEAIEANPEMRRALEEIIGSSWNWGEIIERAARLYGYEEVPKAAHFLSTERIRNLGAEAIEVADDLMEALSLSPSKAAFRRRYRLIKDGIDKQVQEWVRAEPDFPEGVELPMAPLEGLSPEEAQRLMALTGATERNQRHISRARHLLADLARKSGIPIEKAMQIADVAIDKAWNAYSAYGPEATKIRDYFWNIVVAEDPAKRRLWPIYEEKIRKLAITSHGNFDREIANAAIRLGGDPDVIREELGITPWAGPPSDIAARKIRDLQDDIINTVYEVQALELPLAPDGVETPDLETVKGIQEWVTEKPLAANAWLEYMREAIEEKQLAEVAEKVARTAAEQIWRARRASWTQGTARRIELMEQKIARLQEEIATAPVEAADVEQLTGRQQELYEWSIELQGLKETLAGLPTHREIFRFWDYKEGAFRRVRDPSGRVAEFAQSQIVQEIAHQKYGLEQSTQGAEQYGALIRQRLEVYDSIVGLEGLIWEDPEIILPETAEGLEAFITQSEPQLDQMMRYEREPYLFESALQAYQEAVDRLRKIRAGEAMPESVASRVENAKAEIARIRAGQEALRTEMTQRELIPMEGLEAVPKPVAPGSKAIPEVVAPEVAEPARIPTMITTAQREALRELGYSDAMIAQMTPEQALGLIEGQLSDFVPPKPPTGPVKDVESPVMPPSPREGAVLKRDMLLQRMEEWYKDALNEFGKPLEADPTNFENVTRWLEDEFRGHWGQFKIYMDKMGEATTAWTLHDYRKGNIDTLMYRGFWWPYWQTRTGHKWLMTFLENPHKLALWARWHDTHRKINDDLPENYRDTVHLPDWLPVVGGRYWNPYFFFDPIYAWTWSLENFVPTWRREGLAQALVTATPISPLVGMSEWLQPMITEEGRRLEPMTPWTRALYERTGINVEAGVIKGLETAYSEVKPTIYSALERGGTAIGRPELAERVLGGPEVMPMITEGRYQPTYMARVLIDMWIAGEITEEELNETMASREGPIWDRAQDEVRSDRGLTEFSSIFTGVRARRLYPSEYDIEEFKRMRGILRTIEEGPEKREYREQIYEAFPWARQWDVRYDSAESAKMELTISEAWQDIENESVISAKKLADAIRARPGDLVYAREIGQENREREEARRSFWQRQGVSFFFNPRTRTYEEVEDYIKRQILGMFYEHLPQADNFRDEEGVIDWDAYNEATEDFWKRLPDEIVRWPAIEQMAQLSRDSTGEKYNILALAQAVATEEAYEQFRKAGDIPEEALNYTWKKYIIDVANEYYQDELKDLEYDERNMPAFFAEFGQKSAEELIPYILQEYPGRWTEEELSETLAGITMPGIWERWNQNADERSIAISLLWALWGGQTELGKRRFKEAINDPIFNQFFINKETRNYERITNDELQRWLVGPEGLWNIPNPWEDRGGALRTLYYWSVDSQGDPLLYEEQEPEPPTPMPEEPLTPGAEPPPEPPEPTPGGLEQPGGRPLPWSYYRRTSRMIDVPENFWDWVRREYPINPSWRSRVEGARPMVDLKSEWAGYAGGGEITSRHPFGAGVKYVWRHELGHYMDHYHMSSVSQQPEWRSAVERWRDDPKWKESGERVWRYITGGHPHGSEEKPSWLEGYASVATYPFSDVPPYIRKFYPWRDWKELEVTEKRAQQPFNVAERARREAEALAIERDRAFRQEIVIQNAQDMGMTASDLERMWGGNYQEHPIPSMVFAWHHDQYDSPEEARAEWDKIPEADRRLALEWFFDGVWPIVKDDPEDWQNVKDFLDFIGIIDVRAEEPEALWPTRPLVGDAEVLRFLQAGKASHPDEVGPPEEYDVMIRALTTGQGIPEAIAFAQSHLDAHRNALLPSERDTVHDPYPGEPEKNEAAVRGFEAVLERLRARQEPEARGGRPPGMAAPLPTGPEAPPIPETPPPPPAPEQVPPEPIRTIPQLAGTSESDQYRQALTEMEAWVAAGKVGDWTPLMEKWFGRDTPASQFWEFYWAEIPPGPTADEVRKDPIIEMLLNKAFRAVYEVKAGVYESALETLKAWRQAHPEVPGDPKEWAIVRQIVKKYWELREGGAANEARALWMYFTGLLERYYPSTRVAAKPRPRIRAREGGGRGGGGLQAWRRWRRWPKIRYYPRR